MNAIVVEVLQSLRTELREHGITAFPQLTAGLPLIEGNRNQLQQVIHNLIHNAVEAMDATTHRSRMLRLSTERRDRDTVVIAVQDAGPGIDPTRLDDIFDAFFTTKPQGAGTGLGLEIVHRIVTHKFAGKIDVESEPGNTRFIVRLPMNGASTAPGSVAAKK